MGLDSRANPQDAPDVCMVGACNLLSNALSASTERKRIRFTRQHTPMQYMSMPARCEHVPQ